MTVIRASKRLSIALGITVVSASVFGVSEEIEAANFPTQAYFWLDNASPPNNFVPWADYSECKTHMSHTCVVKVSENSSGTYNFRDLYEFSVNGGFSRDTLIFGTAYGETPAANMPLYCTSGGTMDTDPMVNCSRPNNVSVRLVSNENVPNRWAVVGAKGVAAFGANDDRHMVTFNSSGNVNTVSSFRTNPALQKGIYKILIPLAERQALVSDAIAHVQAVQPGFLRYANSQKRICTIHSLTKRSGQNANAAEIEVGCYGRDEKIASTGMTGSTDFQLMEAPFNYIYEFHGGVNSGLIRSVWSNQLVNGKYNPEHSSHAGISVMRIGTGRYTVNLPNTGARETNVQVSAQGTGPRWCNVLSWMPAGNSTDVKIACFKMTASGGAVATDSKFFMGYYFEAK